jgi:hypothetical protein
MLNQSMHLTLKAKAKRVQVMTRQLRMEQLVFWRSWSLYNHSL